MFIDLDSSSRLVKERQQRYRQEAEEYLLEKQLDVRRMGPSITVKMGLVLIGLTSLIVAAQIVIA